MAVSVRQVVGAYGGSNFQTVALTSPQSTSRYVCFVMGASGAPSGPIPDPFVESNSFDTWTRVVEKFYSGTFDTIYTAAFVLPPGSSSPPGSVAVSDANVVGAVWAIIVYELEGVASGTFWSNSSSGSGTTGAASSGTVTHNGGSDAALLGGCIRSLGGAAPTQAGAVTGYADLFSSVSFAGFNSSYDLSFTANEAATWSSNTDDWAAVALGIQGAAAVGPSLVPNLFPRIPRTSLTR